MTDRMEERRAAQNDSQRSNRMDNNRMDNGRSDERMNETRHISGGSGTYTGGDNMPMVRQNMNMTMPENYRDDYRDIYRAYRYDRMNKAEKNIFRKAENYRQYNSEDEIFSCIVDHLTEGVMFHDRMMDLYGFLGLYGFKKMHEYQFYSETMERRKTKCYVLEHMNILVDDGGEKGLQDINPIPQNWYGFTRHDITSEAKKQCIEPSFKAYKQWEEETKELLSYCSNELMYMGKMSDFNTVMEMIEDVDEEMQTVEDLLIKLKSVDYNMEYIMDMQDDVYKEYAHKLEKCFEEKIEDDEKKKMYKAQEEQQFQRRSMRTGRYMRGYY